MASEGWPEGLDKISKELDMNLLDNGASKLWVNDIAGHCQALPRFLAGMPDSMQRRVIQSSRKNPVIDFLVNVGNRADKSVIAITNRGIAIASVIDTLEKPWLSNCR